ncbi:hypothetical protein MiSe_44370 [Microseira wollei NIES-4236]|uniref:Transposase n=1 Tax=Microseira wollei NIES-4236 TaxID=2530354 RepID=A0AAV3XDY0_9CYAN|nr:hypothetical protein MiSe_44370 [Microseira wollei NIES-4236]
MWPRGLAQKMENLPLKRRVSVERCNLKWVQDLVAEKHYLHKPVDRRAIPYHLLTRINYG